ncbi:MAG: GTP 3',8-cyclase MoaA [Cyclobacteriaceae bacterium]
MLYDNHGRKINYVRLAVTDRCNLRCFYCMPESGIKYMNREDLLTFEEMERMLRVFSEQGINKVRITGGEPFVRKGIMEFMESIATLPGIDHINITTNGTTTSQYIDRLQAIGVKSINLSLDSLNKERFFEITRRNEFDNVMDTFHRLLDTDINVKINAVVMEGRNIEDIYPMIELTKNHKVNVRFIEEMPFNGTEGQGNTTYWPMKKILDHIKAEFPYVEKLPDPPSSTSSNYKVKGFKGDFGIIAAYTRTFCGTCNRIRITPQGTLKTCLYEGGGTSLRDIMRSGASDLDLTNHLKKILSNRFKDGFEAENDRKNNPVSESMATIGG